MQPPHEDLFLKMAIDKCVSLKKVYTPTNNMLHLENIPRVLYFK